MLLNSVVAEVTARLVERSKPSRDAYLERMYKARSAGRVRSGLSCGNLAHAIAACNKTVKGQLAGDEVANLAIISAFNDMLSAHQPYETYPAIIKQAAAEQGATAQFAGGVPAMCDGVTQGRDGMELSLFSRDVIAMATAVALSHDVFDGSLCLAVCDKIVPGMMIGSLAFGHLPTAFVPAGPMPSGLPNDEKARVRQLYAQGKVGRDALLKAESESYHSAGTCTFYGTANSNQMLMEIMGLHLPGSSFVNPGTELRDALTEEVTRQLLKNIDGEQRIMLADIVDEKAIVNGVVGLLATGGSTNHAIHLIAIAKAAGIQLTWQDMSDLSDVVPLLCRIYPNGLADVNHFQAAGGMGFLMRELRDAGYLHDDVYTNMGKGLDAYTKEPLLRDGAIVWQDVPVDSLDEDVLRPASNPFAAEGGLKLLKGNLGNSVIKVSAVKAEHRFVQAPAVVFEHQDDLLQAFKEGRLERDFVAVIRFQGPKANGMPELHKLTPTLATLQDRGFKVALVTDGRMSGASGKVPAAIHLSPEALDGGPIGLVRDGDMVELDAEKGSLRLLVDDAELATRIPTRPDLSANDFGMGRELFHSLRATVNSAEDGATIFAME
jgi:phosphogluconate dehydratase